jgi:HJR/Mrr/RecB family endonuclease
VGNERRWVVSLLVSSDESEPETDDGYQIKSPDAGRMGKAVEYLVAAACILTTRGRRNVSTSLVDDEGVDLVFFARGSTLVVQV